MLTMAYSAQGVTLDAAGQQKSLSVTSTATMRKEAPTSNSISAEDLKAATQHQQHQQQLSNMPIMPTANDTNQRNHKNPEKQELSGVGKLKNAPDTVPVTLDLTWVMEESSSTKYCGATPYLDPTTTPTTGNGVYEAYPDLATSNIDECKLWCMDHEACHLFQMAPYDKCYFSGPGSGARTHGAVHQEWRCFDKIAIEQSSTTTHCGATPYLDPTTTPTKGQGVYKHDYPALATSDITECKEWCETHEACTHFQMAPYGKCYFSGAESGRREHGNVDQGWECFKKINKGGWKGEEHTR